MINEIGTVYVRGLNKSFSSRLFEISWFRHETPEEGRFIYRPKHCVYTNEYKFENSKW